MTNPELSPRVIMVKKRLASGEPCKKCGQVEDMLRRRGLWESIDEVIWADETDALSPGMLLANEFQVDLAPFFVVERAGTRSIYTSAITLAKEVLSAASSSPDAAGPAHSELVEPHSLLVLSPTPVARRELVVSRAEAEQAATELAEAEPQAVLSWMLSRLGRSCAIAFSGAEDVALIDMAAQSGHPFSVFCLDTGRLHPETYRFIDAVRLHYGIEIQLLSPYFVEVEALVRKKGLFSFYEDGHKECCTIRKVGPLRRGLEHYEGWVTGQRRDQSPTRNEVPTLVWDETHHAEGMLKANPLAGWSQAQVWKYIRDNNVPYNELHERGFISIGCEPCTRPIRPGEHERAGRWWWEESTARECGLHAK